MPDETLLEHLREVAKRGPGLGRVRILKAAASRSVGIKQGSDLAKMELRLLLINYELLHSELKKLEAKLDELLRGIPNVQQLLAIKGIGRDTIAGFLAEVGNISQYQQPKRIIKLAGLNLERKHVGQTQRTDQNYKARQEATSSLTLPCYDAVFTKTQHLKHCTIIAPNDRLIR